MPQLFTLREVVYKKISSRNKVWILLCILFAIFLLFRWISIIENTSFDFDEVYILRLLKGYPWQFITGTSFDPGTPPLGLILLDMWHTIAGKSEYFLRLLPMSISLVTFFLFTYAAIKILTLPSALTAIFLFAGNGLLTYFGIYLKPYYLLSYLSVVSVLSLYILAHNSNVTGTEKAVHVIVITSGLHAHYSYPLFLFILILSLFLTAGKKVLLNLVKPVGLSLLLYVPWIFLFISQQISPRQTGNKYFFHQVIEGWTGFDGWLSVFSNGMSMSLNDGYFENFIGVLCVTILLLTFCLTFSRIHSRFEKYILCATAISMFFLFFSPLNILFTEPRYWIFLIPLVYLSIGIVLDTINKQTITFSALLLSLFLLISSGSPNSNYMYAWDRMAAVIPAEGKKAAILFSPCSLAYPFSYYYSGTIPVYCLSEKPEGLPYTTWDKTGEKTLYLIKNTNNFGLNYSLYSDLLNTYNFHSIPYGQNELIIFKSKAQ